MTDVVDRKRMVVFRVKGLTSEKVVQGVDVLTTYGDAYLAISSYIAIL